MKKKTALVFSGLLKTWFKNKKNILIGGWCNIDEIENPKYKKFLTVLNKKELKNNEISERKICEVYYEKLLEDVKDNLENHYKVNWNNRSWEIFLGPWLERYISTLFNRYYSLENVLKNYRINDLKINNDKKFNLLTKDQLDFRVVSQDDEWNFKLYSKIYLKYFRKKKGINLHFLNINSKKYSFSNNENVSTNISFFIFKKIKIFFLKIIDKNTKHIFYRTYFGNKRFIFLVNLIKANIPFRYDFNYNLPNIESLNEIRKQKLKSKFKLNKFEKILRDLFFEFLPFYYLEQISNLKDLSKNLFLPSVKNRKIYTAAGMWYDDIFKFWLAEAISKDSKLYYFQHGCNYGITKQSFLENLEIKLSDKFFTWGWKNKKNKIKNFYSIKLIGKKKIKKINSDKILVVGSCPLIYKSGNTSGTTYGKKTKDYLRYVVDLLKYLSDLKKNKIFFRPFPVEDYNHKLNFLSLDRYVKKNLKLIRISNSKMDFYKCLIEYGLTIHTRDGTSFFESIALNKPTILMMPKWLAHQRKSSLKYYSRLKDAKILHENIKSLNNFLKANDFNDWWYDKKTQFVKNEFCKEYCHVVENPVKEFTNKVL